MQYYDDDDEHSCIMNLRLYSSLYHVFIYIFTAINLW